MRFALGTAQFGLNYGITNKSGMLSRSGANIILEASKLHGIDTIDTAIAYGDTEKILGSLGVSSFNIITKIPSPNEAVGNIKDWVHNTISRSSTNLGVKQIYAVLIHNTKDLYSKNGTEMLSALEHLKSIKLIKKIGISVYDPLELAYAISNFNIDIIQAPLNPFDQRLIQSGWLKKLTDLGIDFYSRSIFLQGLLLADKNKLPEYFKRWSNSFQKWHDWLEQNNTNALEACLSFQNSIPEVHRSIIGVTNELEFMQIIKSKYHKYNIFEFNDLSNDSPLLINPSTWK